MLPAAPELPLRAPGPGTMRYRAVCSGGLDGGEGPGPVEDLCVRLVETHDVVPALHEWQAVGSVVAASTEVDLDRAVLVRDGGDAVDAVRVTVVRLEVPVGVVHGDRPERVDRNVLDRERVLTNR